MMIKRDRKKRTVKFITVFIIAFALLLPAGEAFAAGTLKLGSRGPEVARLQQELKNRGYFNFWKITEYFGTITQDAVIRFQRDNGLLVDGIVGPQTRAALYGNNTGSTSSRGALSQRDRDNIFWLARIIHAEARGESYLGQVAVGSVVMNRVAHPGFPNTIYGVIFEYTGSIPQFSPVADGTIYNNPNASCLKAAEEAYFGSKPVGGALFFFNPGKTSASWIVRNRQYVTTIGNHAFYK
ncbi:MAG: cell wall hydrolase [Caldicoprobacterales bacterium]|jgi:N-acetylmuramoyl-L-alanine amidase|nr:cell wall hydrolase [Clostridiales bacterium]